MCRMSWTVRGKPRRSAPWARWSAAEASRPWGAPTAFGNGLPGEHLAEEVAVVPARPLGRVADQLADACVQARHARGVAVLDRLAVGVVAGEVVADAQEIGRANV